MGLTSSKRFLVLAVALLATVSFACAVVAAEQPTVSDTVSTTVVKATQTKSVVSAESLKATSAPVPTSVIASTEVPGETSAQPTATAAPIAGGDNSPVATTVPAPVATTQPQPTPVSVPGIQVPTPEPVATATSTPLPTPTPTTGPPTPTPVSLIPRTSQFVPLDNPVFVSANNAPARVTPESFVLGLEWNGEVRAYPLDIMWWHHIVNDTIGGDPVLVTY